LISFTAGLKLAGSKQTLRAAHLELLREWYTPAGDQVYHLINTGTFSDLVSTEEGKFLRAEIDPASLVVYSQTAYRFEVLVENPIPRAGYLELALP
jgi:hypothetical protein